MRLPRILALILLALTPLQLFAQNTITLTPSVTGGDGSITTNLTWSTNPALTGTPCTASGHPSWTGAKAGAGVQNGIVIATSGTLPLTLTCNFPGDSIVTYSWTPPTLNTDGSAYTAAQRSIVRLKQTFNATLSTGPNCLPTETCTDVDDTTAQRPSMRTVTGVSGTGTLRAVGFARNNVNVFSDPSAIATKTFTGNVPVTQSVSITVNPKPAGLGGFGIE